MTGPRKKPIVHADAPLSVRELACLIAARPTLKRVRSGFEQAPRLGNAKRVAMSSALVRSLVYRDLLAYGNAARSFVAPTAAGRKLIAEGGQHA
jgi:hypothetical protein